MSSGSSENKSQMLGLASQFGIAIPRGESNPNWSYEKVINSRKMAKNLLRHRFDTEEFGPQKELLQIVTYGNDKPEYGIDTLLIQGIESVTGMIEVTKSNSLFELEISASEPKLAADLASTVMEELDLHQRQFNARKTTETRQFIEERLLDTESELEEAEETLKLFRERNRRIFESPQLQLEQERLTRDVAVLIGVFTTLKQQLETAKIEEVKESEYVIILDNPNIPLYPSKPKKKLMVIMAGFLGIGLGMVLAFVLEYIQNSKNDDKKKLNKIKLLLLENISSFIPRKYRK
jgi:capsule polysaccharide export protein KpsE/RkpR